MIKTAPALSSMTPKVGVKISVEFTSEKTPGQWNYKPLAYSYQWQDCNSKGEECTAIPGAVNQAYYPVASDEGHELVAEVVALNATAARRVERGDGFSGERYAGYAVARTAVGGVVLGDDDRLSGTTVGQRTRSAEDELHGSREVGADRRPGGSDGGVPAG